MKWLGTGLIGAAGLAVLLSEGPFGLVGPLADGQFTLVVGVLTATSWLAWAALAGAVVMRLSPSLDPGIVAVRAALGETVGARALAAARQALTGGVAMGGAVFVVGALLVAGDVDGRDGSPWGWVIAVSLTTSVAVVAASLGAALKRPPAPLAEALRGADEVAPPSRRTGVAIVAITAAFGLGALAVAIFADTGSAGFVAALGGGFALVWGVWEWVARGGAEFAPVLLARAARKLGARGGQVGALLADESLARQRVRGRAILGAISFLAMVAAIGASTGSVATSAMPSPAIVIDNVRAADGTACEGACLASLRRAVSGAPAVGAAIPAVRGNLVGDGCSGALLAVDPSVVRAFNAELGAELDSEVVFGGAGSTICEQAFRGAAIESAEGISPSGFEPFLLNAAHVTMSVGGGPDALTVYPSIGEERDAVVAAVAKAAASGGLTYATVYAWDRRPPYATARFAWIPTALLAALLLIPLGALLTSAVSERRRQHATLAALGASNASLRWAIGIDATVRAWSAVLAGLVAGIAVRVVWALVGSVAGPVVPSYGSRLASSLGNIAWLQIGVLALGALGLAVLISFPAALSLSRRTPAESLRADRKGLAS